jgi:Ca2+-binding RTX toxin-like protein
LIGDISTTFFGNDVLRGGTGNDLMSGGGGADQFVFNPADGNDTIGTLSVDYVTPANSAAIAADFQSGLDSIVLAGFGYDTPEEAFTHVTNQSGTATFFDQGTTIIFYGLSVSDLSADDFTVVPTAEDTILV